MVQKFFVLYKNEIIFHDPKTPSKTKIKIFFFLLFKKIMQQALLLFIPVVFACIYFEIKKTFFFFFYLTFFLFIPTLAKQKKIPLVYSKVQRAPLKERPNVFEIRTLKKNYLLQCAKQAEHALW